MGFLLLISGLVIAVLLLEKFKDQLPPPLKLIHTIWTKFSHALGIVMSRIILTILWIIGFGPYALIWKLTHRKHAPLWSHWIHVEETEQNMRFQF